MMEQQNNSEYCVIGWCDTYGSQYKQVPFTNMRKKTLVECIRKRRYNFNFSDYQYLPYCCPVYRDKSICLLTKTQFDAVMDEVYNNIPRGKRLLPIDVLTTPAKNGILFEKLKFQQNFEENNNGKC